jgi:CRISPR-associated exonuclease Cas4
MCGPVEPPEHVVVAVHDEETRHDDADRDGEAELPGTACPRPVGNERVRDAGRFGDDSDGGVNGTRITSAKRTIRIPVLCDRPVDPAFRYGDATTDGVSPQTTGSQSAVAFADLARATYCHRQLYYARRDDDRGPPQAVRERIRLAFRYGRLRRAADATLAEAPIDPPPATYRARLAGLTARDDWASLRSPVATGVRLEGRDCRGVAHKLLAADGGPAPPGGHRDAPGESGVHPSRGRVPDRDPTAGADADVHVDANRDGGSDANPDTAPDPDPDRRSGSPTDGRGVGIEAVPGDRRVLPGLVSPGSPPDRGVWAPQRVKAVAAATALAWERGRPIDRAVVEYPTVPAVRTVRLTARNRDRYRRVLRAVRTREGVPPRTDDRGKCDACEYADACGVRSRSLRSRLGL